MTIEHMIEVKKSKRKIIPHWLLDKLDEVQKKEAEHMLYSLDIGIGAVAKNFGIKHPNSGIKPAQKICLTREQKIDALQLLAKKLGRTPSCNDMNNELFLPYANVYRYAFGSWNNALKVAGLKVVHKTPRKLSVKEKWERYGHIPTTEEIEKDQHKLFFKVHPKAEQHYKHRHKVRSKRYPGWKKDKNTRCIDCGVLIEPESERCFRCEGKHKWKPDTPGRTKNFCKDCGREICQQAIRCRSCGAKHFWHTNERQKDKKFYCVDCDKEVSTNRKRCQSCAIKEMWKLYGRKSTSQAFPGKVSP